MNYFAQAEYVGAFLILLTLFGLVAVAFTNWLDRMARRAQRIVAWTANRRYAKHHAPYDWSERNPELVGRHVLHIRPYRKGAA